MLNLADIIKNSEDVRESKRAYAVSMYAGEIDVKRICEASKVSDSYVSKRKIIYEKEGAEGLLLKYKGSDGYLSAENRKEIGSRSFQTDNLLLYESMNILTRFPCIASFLPKESVSRTVTGHI